MYCDFCLEEGTKNRDSDQTKSPGYRMIRIHNPASLDTISVPYCKYQHRQTNKDLIQDTSFKISSLFERHGKTEVSNVYQCHIFKLAENWHTKIYCRPEKCILRGLVNPGLCRPVTEIRTKIKTMLWKTYCFYRIRIRHEVPDIESFGSNPASSNAIPYPVPVL